MTSQLLILGNGFDRHCDLESDYDHFFECVILDHKAKKEQIIKIQDSCTGFWENIFFKYYKQNPNHEKNWLNIEALIQDTLELLFFGKSKWLGRSSYDIRSMALQYAKSDNRKFKDTNLYVNALLDFCSEFFSKSLQKNSSFNEKKLYDCLSENIVNELHNLERKFCKYLKNQIETSNYSYGIKAVNLLSKIIGFKEEFSSINEILCTRYVDNGWALEKNNYGKHFLKEWFNQLHPVHILSFNYTNIFDILNVDSPCIYSNVHGKLCSKGCKKHCKLSNIIFGIDDMNIKMQDNDNDLRLFSKTYRKMKNASSPTKILPANNGSIEIKFYGHSLGAADYSYFQSIFDYYNLYDNNNVSLIFYYSDGYEQTDAVYRLLNEYGISLPNKQQGKNLIHKLLLENRLKISKV